MTRKDFELVAKTLKDAKASPELIQRFADSLAGTNANFNRDRFIKACGGAA